MIVHPRKQEKNIFLLEFDSLQQFVFQWSEITSNWAIWKHLSAFTFWKLLYQHLQSCFWTLHNNASIRAFVKLIESIFISNIDRAHCSTSGLQCQQKHLYMAHMSFICKLCFHHEARSNGSVQSSFYTILIVLFLQEIYRKFSCVLK